MQLDDDIIRTFGIGRVYKVVPRAEIAIHGLVLHMQPWRIPITVDVDADGVLIAGKRRQSQFLGFSPS
jgi:hypothetical protein